MNEREDRKEKERRYIAAYTCCAGCAKKLERNNVLAEMPGESKMGQCPLCFGIYYLSTYRITPIRPRYRSRAGGGERARAGGGK